MTFSEGKTRSSLQSRDLIFYCLWFLISYLLDDITVHLLQWPAFLFWIIHFYSLSSLVLSALYRYATVKWIMYITISQCKKKLVCLLFDFSIINTMDDDCEQQIPKYRSPCTTVYNNGGEMTSCSADNCQGLMPIRSHNNICTFKTRISLQGASECDNRISDATS